MRKREIQRYVEREGERGYWKLKREKNMECTLSVRWQRGKGIVIYNTQFNSKIQWKKIYDLAWVAEFMVNQFNCAGYLTTIYSN